MNNKSQKLIIFGAGVLGHLAFEYFTKDSEYDVVGFAVDPQYMQKETFCGLPLIDFSDIEERYSPEEFDMYIALGWYRLNQNRIHFYKIAKGKGYKLASYISTKAFVWDNVAIGDNCFIMEGCVLQPWVVIGNNVTLWSQCCVEHYSKIENNCSLAARCVIAGDTVIGENCFIGVNASVANSIKVAKNNFIAMGSVIRKSTMENSIYEGNPGKRNRFITAQEFLKA